MNAAPGFRHLSTVKPSAISVEQRLALPDQRETMRLTTIITSRIRSDVQRNGIDRITAPGEFCEFRRDRSTRSQRKNAPFESRVVGTRSEGSRMRSKFVSRFSAEIKQPYSG